MLYVCQCDIHSDLPPITEYLVGEFHAEICDVKPYPGLGVTVITFNSLLEFQRVPPPHAIAGIQSIRKQVGISMRS